MSVKFVQRTSRHYLPAGVAGDSRGEGLPPGAAGVPTGRQLSINSHIDWPRSAFPRACSTSMIPTAVSHNMWYMGSAAPSFVSFRGTAKVGMAPAVSRKSVGCMFDSHSPSALILLLSAIERTQRLPRSEPLTSGSCGRSSRPWLCGTSASPSDADPNCLTDVNWADHIFVFTVALLDKG